MSTSDSAAPKVPLDSPEAVVTTGAAVPVGEPAKRRRVQRPKAMPLRTWLLVLMVLVSGLGLAGSSLAVSSIMTDVMYANVDEQLKEATNGWVRNLSNDSYAGDYSRRPPTEYVVLSYLPDGTILYTGPNASMPDAKKLYIDDEPATINSVGDSETKWRAVAIKQNGTVTIVAKDLTRETIMLRGLAIVQIIITAVVMGIIAVVGMWFIRRALRPLRVVEKTASQIAAGDLDKRVPDWPLHTEVGQLSAALNIMLGQLQRSVVQAQEKEEQMRRFVGDASHELRTPLTSLRGYTELYRSGATQDVDMVFSKIDDESKRMSLLVEDLLALTRAEGSRLDMGTVDMLELVLSAGSSARAAFPGRQIDVVNEAADIPLVKGDPDRLHQVLLNLVSNALRHGGEEAKVKLTIREEAGEKGTDVLIDVADDGKGMAPEDASHIFERFYRADTSRTRDTGGSGLGLAIVKSLVEQHGGRISVESALGEGSTFTLRLPALAA
ncbi:two-component system sensor kinase [Corynebacterium striatum]|uniref:histidine kinase n=2 Tax=Corynebacterium striatum TaxID=43770 RepID=A0ABC9ZI95_CORST|nr:HAMP domain-containing sensor histidine kinase [Corynebacterium striatum]GEA41884.1 two-component sensor histidine kinase [Corynebacterium striatum]STD38689.1 two-component system sensor kinase [Corynebacterium striatum]STD62915.1 two-component system sensor kinase [Corynebacterium striatum]